MTIARLLAIHKQFTANERPVAESRQRHLASVRETATLGGQPVLSLWAEDDGYRCEPFASWRSRLRQLSGNLDGYGRNAARPASATSISCGTVPPLVPMLPTTWPPTTIGMPPPSIVKRGCFMKLSSRAGG